MELYKLYTKRLLIRPFTMSDLDSLIPILSDPKVMAFIGNGPLKQHEIHVQLEQWIHDFTNDGYGFMAFIDQSTGHCIGYGGFLHQIIEGQIKIELGFVLAKPYWGKGLAFEAATALKDFGFHSLKMDELISIIHEANVPSQKLASKLGMTIEKQITIDGEPCLIYHCFP